MTTARPQQRYDHRLRELVHRTGNLTIATDLSVPPSTAPTVVAHEGPALRQQIGGLRDVSITRHSRVTTDC